MQGKNLVRNLYNKVINHFLLNSNDIQNKIFRLLRSFLYLLFLRNRISVVECCKKRKLLIFHSYMNSKESIKIKNSNIIFRSF